MEAYQIVAGFSDIKSEFIRKTRTPKSLQELRLWFSFEDEVLYAHDYFDHARCIVLAVRDPATNTWKIYLKKASYGEPLVEMVTGETALSSLQKAFNELYKSYGFMPFCSR